MQGQCIGAESLAHVEPAAGMIPEGTPVNQSSMVPGPNRPPCRKNYCFIYYKKNSATVSLCFAFFRLCQGATGGPKLINGSPGSSCLALGLACTSNAASTEICPAWFWNWPLQVRGQFTSTKNMDIGSLELKLTRVAPHKIQAKTTVTGIRASSSTSWQEPRS